jgi:hypothetical protein
MKVIKLNTKILFILLLPLLFTSCFEIIEDVHINTNGSGKISVTLNLSQSKTKLKTIMLMDSINGYKIPSKTDINTELNNAVKTLKGIKGLSNIKSSSDFDAYIFKISCNFTDIDKLNQVVSTFARMNNFIIPKGSSYFDYNQKTKIFTRNYETDLAKSFNSIKKKDKEVFDNASYVTVYHFDNTIIESKNKSAHINKNKTAIMIKVSAQDIINNTRTIKNQIKLK